MERAIRRGLFWTILLYAALLSVHTANAQTYPVRPIKLYVGLGPGSGTDIVTRYFAERVGNILGQPVVVENRPGADMVLAVQAMLSAPPDGYSALMILPSIAVINPLLKSKLPYDFQRDIRPLASLARGALVYVTQAGGSRSSMKDLLAKSRAAPNAISVGSYAKQVYLSIALLEQLSGAAFNQVPYRSPSALITDLISGTVEVGLVDFSAALPHIKSGKLQPLAVTGTERSQDLPEIPTVNELGIPGYRLYAWIGVGVRSGTPDAVASRLEQAFLEVAAQPATRDFLMSNGRLELLDGTGARFSELIASERAEVASIVKTLGLQPE